MVIREARAPDRRLRTVLFTVGAAVFLTACATRPEPVIRTVEVKVPVAIPCAADPGPDPVYPDTDAALRAAPNILERTRLLLAARLLRMAREAELKAAVAGCG